MCGMCLFGFLKNLIWCKVGFLYFFQVINKMIEFEDDIGKKMKVIEIYDLLIKYLIEKLIKRF